MLPFFRILGTWPSRGFDRVRTSAHGLYAECFDPRWYELHRWLWWWFRARRIPRGTTAMLRNGEWFTVRVFIPLASVPRRWRGRHLN